MTRLGLAIGVPAALVLCVGVVALTSSTGCNNGCEDATRAMQDSIVEVCKERDFANSPFCACCVPNGYFAMDDTCSCRPLVLDADFCFYQEGDGGYPAVRAALVHASSVCESRSVNVPSGDVIPAVCTYTPDASSTVVDASDASTDGNAIGDVVVADAPDGG